MFRGFEWGSNKQRVKLAKPARCHKGKNNDGSGKNFRAK